MAIDTQLEMAIRDAVIDAKQPQGVALKLIAWLENSIDGNENPLDEGSYSRHLDLIYEEMLIEEEE